MDLHGSPDDDFPDACHFAEYRGARYRVRLDSVRDGTTEIPLLLDHEPDLEQYPDARGTDRFHVHWTVTVPRRALSRLYLREGFGSWVDYRVRFGPLRERYRRRPILLEIDHPGAIHPVLAEALGIAGHWRNADYRVMIQDPAEVEDLEIRVTELPAGPGWAAQVAPESRR